ncbi:carbohydrate-binding protein [Aestuariibaculum marinum]|uniref:Chitin-binding type-3 domain-containing protein n=1 Tax=Aestuariibaculum marinum TaxID=2683592 RepID=A0A8J6U2T8_9FLAO|nr:carbohydrate-binding protein [Aestuariibaculum marinum]MBD0822657.1 hypothetical protein [Aestuariibaculum marinum]
MKAIIATALDKQYNAAYLGNAEVGSIKTFIRMPKDWRHIVLDENNQIDKALSWSSAFFRTDTDKHAIAGFYDVVVPAYNTQTQYYLPEQIYFDVENLVFTYPVHDFTQAEIDAKLKDEKINESNSLKQELIQQKLEAQILESAQAESDDTVALDNQALYPFWEVGVAYTVGFKVQAFDGVDVFLYKCVQPHTSQEDWQPKDVPALFTKVAYPGEIPVFVQPTGAQDAYNTGDQVHYPTENDPVYESLIDDNVWSPTDYPQGWQQV